MTRKQREHIADLLLGDIAALLPELKENRETILHCWDAVIELTPYRFYTYKRLARHRRKFGYRKIHHPISKALAKVYGFPLNPQ